MGGGHGEDDMMGRPRWGDDTMRRERWREHNGERTRCGEVDTMGGGHNGGGHSCMRACVALKFACSAIAS